MDLSAFLMAAFLGVVEGVTEFLPISSTGHLILVEDLLGFEGPRGKLFEIVIQLGAILSVVWIYRDKLWRTAMGLFSSGPAQRLTFNILIAFLPAALVGVLAHDFIKASLFSPWVVSVALVAGGIAILMIERLQRNHSVTAVEDISPGRALAIGLFQCLAMIPGVSRAAATIMGALLMGVRRPAAAEFSFLLAIPTMFGATAYDLYRNRDTLNSDGLAVIAVGFVVSFMVALIVVKWLLRYISIHDFSAFAIYRIFVGIVMLGILLAR
ncbi:MAG: undecaprenyl-diphosphate phosphatase [Rhodospirillaceae bacterium]|nr:undecaprenyl-diphosphate phosphatase [Rhodospirillaceae bacterium]